MLKAETKIDGNKAVIALSGRADTPSSECVFTEFEKAVGADCESVEYDLTNVEYICSATLRAFLKSQKECNRRGIDMCISNAAEGVKEIFEITSFSSLIKIL